MCTTSDAKSCTGCGSCSRIGAIATTTTRKPVIVAPTLIEVSAEDEPLYRKLIDAAKRAAEVAYRPYSQYNVGAAVLTFDGRIYVGCNVENAGYTQTKHAEEVAITSAIVDGVLARAEAVGLTQFQAFLAVAVHAPKGSDPWPCCNCRQSLSEFGFDMHIIGDAPDGSILCLTLGQLIPFPFPIEEVLASVRGTSTAAAPAANPTGEPPSGS
jgi:cytidine deaminase